MTSLQLKKLTIRWRLLACYKGHRIINGLIIEYFRSIGVPFFLEDFSNFLCRLLWPILHGPMILHNILNTIMKISVMINLVV